MRKGELDATELQLECGSVVTITRLETPFRGYSFRCEGVDAEGVYASKLGITSVDAIERWRKAIKWERWRAVEDSCRMIEARKERGKPQYFNGRKVQ